MVLKRESWVEGAKVIGKGISILDRGVSLSRNTVLGQYLSRENKDGLYFAEISIIDPVVEAMAPKTIEADPCSGKTEILDMEIRVGSSDCINQALFSVRNYSKNVAEITFENGYRFLITPNDVISGSQVFYLRGLGNLDRFKWNANKKVPLTLQKLDTRFPERNITFSCDDKNPPDIWGIRIEPKCLETGTYADYTNSSRYPVDVILDNSTIRLDPSKSLNWPAGNLRSNSRTVTIKIRANLN